jgi:hypothetical protein
MKMILVAALIAAGSQAAEAADWRFHSIGENLRDCRQSAQERFDGCLESESSETIQGETPCLRSAGEWRDVCDRRYKAAVRWIDRAPPGEYGAHHARRHWAAAEMSGACEPMRELQALWGRF